MNYIQIENFGGKAKAGFKFNQLSLEIFTKNIREEKEKIVLSTIYATFYAGLCGNAYAKQEDEDFTFENVCDWVDELIRDGREKDLENVCETWTETFTYKEWLKAYNDALNEVLEIVNKPDKKKVK